jgi:hypothetical protein
VGTALLMRRVWQLYVTHVLLFIFYAAAIGYVAERYGNSHLLDEFNVAGMIEQPVATLSPRIRYLLVNNDVVAGTHGERALLSGRAVLKHALNREPMEVFEARESSEALTTVGGLESRIQCVERVSVVLVEAHSIISNNEAIHCGDLVDDVELAVAKDCHPN